ncbi:MAG: glycoside hydrolase family 2 [Bacteroidales bacterium]|nr:glycoside hydrolase family 2 [Bacteroidales bacterium]
MVLSDNWYIRKSGELQQTGVALSSVSYKPENWYKASVPATVMGILTANGLYNDLFVGENYKSIDTRQFDESWWFRKEFELPVTKAGEHITLHFDGINYRANIWLNGILIASRDSVSGTFRQFEFDITGLVHENGNILAVEVFRAQAGDLNLGFVDWNPRPADENMGIWRPVYIEITGEVNMKNTTVQTIVDTLSLKEAWLTVKTTLVNKSQLTIQGFVSGNLENNVFNFPVTLQAGETKEISLSPAEIPALYVLNPRLWWCNNLGEPEMYDLSLQFTTSGRITDSVKISFGIRQVGSYTNAAGHKGFTLNGRKVLIKGAGWTDDIFLRDTKNSLETQIRYVKHMNLNTIRLESFWGTSHDLYDLCDKYGIMIMAGWSCQWEWEEYFGKPCDEFGGIKSEEEMDLAVESLRDQILWLRRHPSIFVWLLGSDKLPRPKLEQRYKNLLGEIDDRPYLLSAGTRVSELSGPTGVKMNGPYEYVAPVYWYMDTINGGAFGFNTETGPGAQIPQFESIKKMIPADKLWPAGKAWDYHCTHSLQGFNTMEVTTRMIENRYGMSSGIDGFMKKADAQSYEAMRAMFEAFRARLPKTTGIIQWMLNAAWPSIYWHLYDYYLLPTPAYYAVRKANEPLQLIYDYSNNTVIAVNETSLDVEDIKATIKLFDLNSNVLFQKEVNFTISSNKSEKIIGLNPVSAHGFLDLKLMDSHDKLISQNFYWLSKGQDVFDWDKTTWAYTPLKEFADFTWLDTLSQTSVSASCVYVETGENFELTTTIANQGNKIAFLINPALTNESGDQVSPVFWDDNYFSLLPGEKRNIRCLVPKSSIKTAKHKLVISGWNIETQTLSLTAD